MQTNIDRLNGRACERVGGLQLIFRPLCKGRGWQSDGRFFKKGIIKQKISLSGRHHILYIILSISRSISIEDTLCQDRQNIEVLR